MITQFFFLCGGNFLTRLYSSLIPGTVPQRPGRHRAEIQPAVLIRWWRSGSDWAEPGMPSSSTHSATHTHTHTEKNNFKISKWLKLWKWIKKCLVEQGTLRLPRDKQPLNSNTILLDISEWLPQSSRLHNLQRCNIWPVINIVQREKTEPSWKSFRTLQHDQLLKYR